MLNQALSLIDALQDDLNDLRDQLAWANRLSTLGTLTAGLAHEFNNLLTPIGSYAQLALNDPDNTPLSKKALRIAVDNVNQANRLVQATLSFASPNPIDSDTSCNLNEVVERSLACTHLLLERERIQTLVVLPDVRVAIDELALQQVLINLINNARNAMQGIDGPKRLTIKAKHEIQTVVLEVSDTGCGIPEAIRDRLFEPFVTQTGQASDLGPQTAAATSIEAVQPPPAGSGLGLSICKRLIETAGGSISAQPGEEHGSTLRIILPIATPIEA